MKLERLNVVINIDDNAEIERFKEMGYEEVEEVTEKEKAVDK